MSNFLFDARFAYDGKWRGGPITTTDRVSFVFRNTLDSLDMYFELRKNEKGEWRQTGGPVSFDYPREVIQDVGRQIDEFMQSREE